MQIHKLSKSFTLFLSFLFPFGFQHIIIVHTKIVSFNEHSIIKLFHTHPYRSCENEESTLLKTLMNMEKLKFMQK